jgi:malate synthase
LPETAHIRNSDWTVAPLPQDLIDRRGEITGPADRKMIINALNSGSKVFMADFEDANSPTWENCIEGQINLRNADNRTITYEYPEGKKYKLKETWQYSKFVRTAGVLKKNMSHWTENRFLRAYLISGFIFTIMRKQTLIANGSGLYFYLPKMESHLEAGRWNDVFVFAQNELGIPQGMIKAIVLIETILATFEADEILYELREYSAGLNCRR